LNIVNHAALSLFVFLGVHAIGKWCR
jgi:hypothetical protein